MGIDLEKITENESYGANKNLNLEGEKFEDLWDLYFKNGKNTGIINKQLIKAYRFLKKKKNMHGFVDSTFQAYVGGTMTQEDQEEFAKVAGKEGYKLTIQNSLINIGLSPQYYFAANSLDNELAGYGLAGLVIGGNLTRIFKAWNNKKSYAGFSFDSLIINAPSYVKQVVNSVKGDKYDKQS